MGAKRRRTLWKWHHREAAGEWQDELLAVWEVSLDPISNGYTPEDVAAEDLLRLWADRVDKEYPNGLIPINWIVKSKQTWDVMPLQFDHIGGNLPDDFLKYYTWPVSVETDERLDWLRLPVADKLWNARRADKGGFIQQATGWKPAILQPYVYLPSLLAARNTRA